jgi:hypothetical protein
MIAAKPSKNCEARGRRLSVLASADRAPSQTVRRRDAGRQTDKDPAAPFRLEAREGALQAVEDGSSRQDLRTHPQIRSVRGEGSASGVVSPGAKTAARAKTAAHSERDYSPAPNVRRSISCSSLVRSLARDMTSSSGHSASTRCNSARRTSTLASAIFLPPGVNSSTLPRRSTSSCDRWINPWRSRY